MNSLVKWILIAAVAMLAVRMMRQGWGGAGGEMPKSVAGLVAKAKTLDRKLVVLITGSTWCPPCQAMERELLGSAEWTAFAGKEIVFQAFDYPGGGGEPPTPAHADLLKLPGFEGFPTLVVANSSGKLLAMRSGYGGDPGEYIKWIRSL